MIIECWTSTAEGAVITALLRQGLHLGRDVFRTTLPDRKGPSVLRTRRLSADQRSAIQAAVRATEGASIDSDQPQR
ncbi:MAG TPA: hypothetical protein VGJ87_26905 [Roseiflexaceae bacterium]|jgi:hypothetical protein